MLVGLFDHLDPTPHAVARVQELLGEVMGLESPSIDEPVLEMGLDSLMAVELGNRIEELFGVKVPVGEILSGISVGEIASKVKRGLTSAPAELGADEAQNLLARLDQLSDEEVSSLLRTMPEEGA